MPISEGIKYEKNKYCHCCRELLILLEISGQSLLKKTSQVLQSMLQIQEEIEITSWKMRANDFLFTR
jgi:hypothetical protein